MRRVLAVVLLSALVSFATACGGGETTTPMPEEVQGTVPEEKEAAAEGDPEAGAQVYASAGCGSCHVFAAAGSSGTAGPNLDESDVTYDEAVEQIANGGGGMPAFKDRMTEDQIRTVAEFVARGR